MLGNPNWFKRRKYTGWGITPKSWQGWVYILGILGFLLSFQLIASLEGMSQKYHLIITLILFVIVLIDFMDLIRKIKLDERESLHEAISERNAAWLMVLVLCIGTLYQSILSAMYNSLSIDPFIVVALIGGTIVKSFSNWYLSDR